LLTAFMLGFSATTGFLVLGATIILEAMSGMGFGGRLPTRMGQKREFPSVRPAKVGLKN